MIAAICYQLKWLLNYKSWQDKVEVQPIDIAEKFQRELGIDIHEHFETLASEPMASASIGQVFKGAVEKTDKMLR